MQLTLEESTSNAYKYHSTSSHAKKLNKVVAYFIAKEAFRMLFLRCPLTQNLLL